MVTDVALSRYRSSIEEAESSLTSSVPRALHKLDAGNFAVAAFLRCFHTWQPLYGAECRRGLIRGLAMKPRMSPDELALFQAVLKKSSRYLEFGSGGSTFLASSLVKSWVISIDSSQSWLEKVRDACKSNRVQPELILADIGPIGDWGKPT